MDSTDLFSFLNEGAPEDYHDPEKDALPTVHASLKVKPVHKRKAESPSQYGGTVMQDVDSEPGPSIHKKSRVASPKPVVLDDFETEAKREVAASAGLTGGVDSGTRLELRHQVRYCYALQRCRVGMV